jgi:hypothetical protein
MSDRAEKSARKRAEKVERQRVEALAAFEQIRADAETKAWARGRELGWMEAIGEIQRLADEASRHEQSARQACDLYQHLLPMLRSCAPRALS